MASYATIPAEAETEKPLLNRDVRVNLKTVIGGAAVASFVLGALAAAVVSGPARTNSAALYAHSGYQPSAHAPMAFHAGKKNGESCKEDYNLFTIPMDPKGDDDNLEDLCMGTKRTYDEKLEEGKFELVGVNCGGDSFVEGDVLFTMYPKYELAY